MFALKPKENGFVGSIDFEVSKLVTKETKPNLGDCWLNLLIEWLGLNSFELRFKRHLGMLKICVIILIW